MTQTPAGWYADPSNPAQQRYWDGAQWTEHVAVAAAPATPVAPTPPTPFAPSATPAYYPVEPTKKKLSGGAIAAIVIGSLVLLGILVVGVLAAIAVPIYADQSASAVDASAKADVSTLGKEIATYYVDNSGPAPQIEVSGDYYLIDIGTAVPLDVAKSEGVEFGSIQGTGSLDWCVWVEAPAGDLKTFQYSAAGGLEVGTCQ